MLGAGNPIERGLTIIPTGALSQAPLGGFLFAMVRRKLQAASHCTFFHCSIE